jgi:transaldolase
MPEETIRAFQDHGKVAPTLKRRLDEAQRVFEQLAHVGVDYDDVTATLEKEGIQKFTDSFEELLKAIGAKRQEVAR